jgi:hypothetical protein
LPTFVYIRNDALIVKRLVQDALPDSQKRQTRYFALPGHSRRRVKRGPQTGHFPESLFAGNAAFFPGFEQRCRLVADFLTQTFPFLF